MKFLCRFGFHEWNFAFVHHGESLKYVRCERCGKYKCKSITN